MKVLMGILFAVIFFVVGATVFALLAPLLFKGGDPSKIGEAVGPLILFVAGPTGFIFGYRRRKKRESAKQSQQNDGKISSDGAPSDELSS
jgi:hypothetical protein